MLSSNGKFNQLTRGGGSDTPPPPLPAFPQGFYTPTIVALNGISGFPIGFTPTGTYFGIDTTSTSLIRVTTYFRVIADNSGGVMGVNISIPFPGNFTASKDSQFMGFSMIKTSDIGQPGSIGEGAFQSLAANLSGGVDAQFEGAQPSVDYTISLSFTYQIQ